LPINGGQRTVAHVTFMWAWSIW